MSNVLLTTGQAAKALGLSTKTLERYRLEGSGPTFVKLGSGKRAPVRYRQADLDAWVNRQRFTSTAEFGAEVL